MHPVLRILGIGFAFALTAIAWLTLGGVTSSRTSEQQLQLDGRVSDLWGRSQSQSAPRLQQEWVEEVPKIEYVKDDKGNRSEVRRIERVQRTAEASVASTRATVDLRLDQRRKGLLWFPLYDVAFDGTWTYQHGEPDRDLRILFAFPDTQGIYDGFYFRVNGQNHSASLSPADGRISAVVPVKFGETVEIESGYRSRGMRTWEYKPTDGVGQIEDFLLTMTTDFSSIDFPALTMSPSRRETADGGWKLEWGFSRLVSGYGIGMAMPERIQPGELASEMSFSAALPLGLFFLWIYVLGLLRGTEIHPVNYLFIAGAFFAFNLLFSYTADHLPLEWAFLLASVVSVGLVVSYLRLVVGPRFAFLEAGLAQILYQVGFSAAHLGEGYTGLTITVLGIVTLFALMQLTGRVNWSTVLQAKRAPAPA